MNTKKIIKGVLLEVAGISFEVRKWANEIENYVKDYVASEREKMKSQMPPKPVTPAIGQKPKNFSWSAPKDNPLIGKRVTVISIDDKDTRLKKGDQGTISDVYPEGDIDVDWDNGEQLVLLPSLDKYTIEGEPSVDDKDDDVYDYAVDYTHFEDEYGDVFETANVYADELRINADVSHEFPNIKSVVTGKLFKITLDGKGSFFVDSEGGKFPEEYRQGIEEMIEDHMVSGEPFYTDSYELVWAVNYDDDDYGNHYLNNMSESTYDDYNRGYSQYGGYYQQPKIDKIEINGKDFPDAYKDFNVDKWIITSSNRIEYDHWKSGYNDAGEYVVYLNMPMGSVGGSALVHEIKHAYDDWNRMRKGKPPIRAGWEIQNIYTPDFEKLVLGGSVGISPMLNPIIRYYYLGSKLESPAYLENEYDNSMLSGNYRDTAKKLMNFKASNFLDKNGNPAKGLQESWTKLITQYNIPFFRKFKNVVDFLNYTEKYFNKRGRDIIKRIDKMRYVHNKPAPVYTPPKTTYTPPKATTPLPKATNTPPVVNTVEPVKSNQTEIERLDKQIDRLEDEWDKLRLEDPVKNKLDLEELDTIIRGLIKKRNSLSGPDLPF